MQCQLTQLSSVNSPHSLGCYRGAVRLVAECTLQATMTAECRVGVKGCMHILPNHCALPVLLRVQVAQR
jgi:hypothetical protein